MKQSVLARIRNSRLAQGAFSSLLDQALLSILGLGVGLAFIRFGEKSEYSVYAQVTALVFLTTAIQSALINSPSTNILPNLKSDADKHDFKGGLLALQLLFSTLIGLAVWALVRFQPEVLALTSGQVILGGVVALAVWSAWARDFVRNLLFLELRPSFCLGVDTAFAIASASAVAILAIRHKMSAHEALIWLSAIGIASAAIAIWRIDIDLRRSLPHVRGVLRKVAPMAAWALPGGIVSWISGPGYVFFSAHLTSAEASAELVAARLFMAPLGLLFLSWSNVFRPHVTTWLAQGKVPEARKASLMSFLGIVGLVCGYVLALQILFPFLGALGFGKNYPGIQHDIMWWTPFFCASGFSNIGTGILLAVGRFKATFFSAAAGSLLSVPLLYVLSEHYQKTGTLIALGLGEAITAAFLIWNCRDILVGERK